MDVGLRAKSENYYKVLCHEHLHEDGHACLLPRDLDFKEGGCFRKHTPRLKWEEDIKNLVTTAGLNKLLDACFKTGLASPLWYVGLVNNASFSAYAAGDTLASHSGWLEGSPYAGNRPAFTPGSIAGGSVDNSASKAAFSINTTLTVRGAFICDAASGNSGGATLYGEGDFSTGSRAVLSGDTLSVLITLTQTSA